MDPIQHAAKLLCAGSLVAFPTETVYGLGANALDAGAVARIFQVKGRPPESPIIVHAASVAMARGLARDWPEAAETLAQKWWPGPLTLVLTKTPSIPDIVTAGLRTVGLRVPSHPLALALIRAAGVPVAAPSANRFGELSPTTAEHVRRSLGDAVDFILEGGPAEVGIESTVVSLAGAPTLLRPGMIAREEIEAIAGPLAEPHQPEGAHPAPGMHARHYSPRTPLLIGDPPREGRGAWLWWGREHSAARVIRLPADPAGYAGRLYAVLHEMDGAGLDWIAVEPVPPGPEWEAVRDRLRRAQSLQYPVGP
ncbi:MAG: L-threonylcarbamoyladenylate synthase [Bryobacteraceae bacterium]